MSTKPTLYLITLSLMVLPYSAQADDHEDAFTNDSVTLTLEDLRTFAEVFNQVRSHYVEELGEREVLSAAIDGMIDELDPYSDFLTPDEFRAFDDNAAGQYGGIGVDIVIERNRLVVERVIAVGPAGQAGVLEGDVIISVDGIPVRGRRLSASMEALRGQADTGVTVEFMTPGSSPRSLELTRATLDVTSVFSLLEDGIGLIRITHFTRQTGDEFQLVMNSLEERNQGPLDGVVLDLRSNPGGVIRPAVQIADFFLDEGLIVYTQSRYGPSQLEIRATDEQWSPEAEVLILVDGRTASAAEVLSGALKDNGRARLLGEKTFGKGSIQSLLRLSNGSALKLTTAWYYTPSGRIIHDNGLEAESGFFDEFPDLAGQVAPFETDAGIRAAFELIRSRR